MAAQKQKVKTGSAVISKVKLAREKEVRMEITEKEKIIEESYVDVSKLLSESYHQKYYAQWGFETFDAYADQELSMGYRKAMYMVQIWDAAEGAGLAANDLASIGWSKMKEIASVITAKNAKSLMKKADEMSVRELNEAVKIMRETDKYKAGDLPTIVTLSLRMEQSEHEIIMEAINQAKQVLSTESDVLALEGICQDWMEAKGTKPEVTPLEDHIAYLEKAYPVKIEFKILKEKAKKQEEAKAEKAETAEGGDGKGRKEKVGKKEKSRVADPDELPQESSEGEDKDINSLLGIRS